MNLKKKIGKDLQYVNLLEINSMHLTVRCPYVDFACLSKIIL